MLIKRILVPALCKRATFIYSSQDHCKRLSLCLFGIGGRILTVK
jgi:hypothetical protein